MTRAELELEIVRDITLARQPVPVSVFDFATLLYYIRRYRARKVAIAR